jgi:hypothetical protein
MGGNGLSRAELERVVWNHSMRFFPESVWTAPTDTSASVISANGELRMVMRYSRRRGRNPVRVLEGRLIVAVVLFPFEIVPIF